MKELTCARDGCGQTFAPVKPNHVYCSHECQHRQSRVRAASCAQEGCESRAFSRGLCQPHYDRLRRSGTLPPLRFDRECVVCEKSFTTKAYQQITCSADCLKVRKEQTQAERMRTSGCVRCGLTFERTRKGGGSYCPACERDYAREQREKDPEKAKAYGRKQNLWVKYRMTPEQYDVLLAQQGGVCAICQCDDGDMALAVDHDHACCAGDRSCGRCIRGLLCGNCNNGLGRFDDDARRLRAAAEYLERTRQPALFIAA